MRWSTRELVTIGLFGALWGSVEIGLGGILHAFRLPFSGAALAGCGMLVALSGRVFVDRRGAIIFIGVVTALLKMLSVGGLVFRPMLGILAESLLAEAVLLAAPPSRGAFTVAGIVAVLWTLIHPFLTGVLLAGQTFFTVATTLLQSGARLLRVDSHAGMVIVVVLVAVHLAVGGIAGSLAWSAARTIRERLEPAEGGDR